MSWRGGIAAAGRAWCLGGLHVLSCPEEAAPHADALAIGEGVQLWPRILRDVEAGTLEPVYRGELSPALSRRSGPASRSASPPVLSDDDEPDRDAGLPQSLRLLLPGHRGADDAVPGSRRRSRSSAEFEADDQPYGVFVDNNLGSRPEYLRRLCRALRPLEKIWSAAVSIDVTDDPTLVREMALAGCTGVFVGFESLADRQPGRGPQEDAAHRPTMPGGCTLAGRIVYKL